jgi:hypothetical protein
VEPFRQVALGNAVVVAEDPEASGLTRVDLLFRQHLEHQLPVQAHRLEKRMEDAQGKRIDSV